MSWKNILKIDNDFDSRFQEAIKNFRNQSEKLQSILQMGGNTTSAMKELKQAEKQYKKLLRESKVREKDKRRLAREEKRALIPLKEEAKKVKKKIPTKEKSSYTGFSKICR